MATPALKFESEEPPVEDRIGKLEAQVEHIRVDVADTKIEVRRLNDKLDNVNQTLSTKIDAVYQQLSELKIGRALDRVWWLLICGTLLGVMARGFKWI
jgi:vacuolar-type H+-ATPase subunit I/STV1